jgi:serine/threonine-protein kinase RsbW
MQQVCSVPWEPKHADHHPSDDLPARDVNGDGSGPYSSLSSRELRPHEVEVRMLAGAATVSTVRAVAADIAMRADYDLDSVSDLRLAVDEACTTVLTGAKPNGTMICRLLITPECVEICASAATYEGRPPPRDTLGWHMLQVLADSVQYWTTEDDGERLMHVRITRGAVSQLGSDGHRP